MRRSGPVWLAASDLWAKGSPTLAVAQAFVHQTHLVALLLRDAPADRIAQTEQDVLARMAERWDTCAEADRGIPFVYLHLVARKP